MCGDVAGVSRPLLLLQHTATHTQLCRGTVTCGMTGNAAAAAVRGSCNTDIVRQSVALSLQVSLVGWHPLLLKLTRLATQSKFRRVCVPRLWLQVEGTVTNSNTGDKHISGVRRVPHRIVVFGGRTTAGTQADASITAQQL